MNKYISVIAIVGLLVLGAFVSFASIQSVEAAPPAAPTPLSNQVIGGDAVPAQVVFMPQTALTAAASGTARNVGKYDQMTFEVNVDQHPTNVNTATVTLYVSVTGTNYDAGPALVSANTADVTEVTPIQRVGQYVQPRVTLANTYPVTITINAYLE